MENLSYIGCFLSGITSVIIVTLGIYQLYGLRKSINQSNLMAIFEVEFELNKRKVRMADIRTKNQELLASIDLSNITQKEKEDIKIRDGLFEEALEDYLNVFDRLSYFIIKKFFREEDFRIEYRDMLFETIKENSEKFQIGTQYRNMVKLHDKWKEL
ncbi:hypothetical protein [Clostridium botulinum]|uniref:hypothetical protein n=1 Tax=Clostridium botulinum TaxID=1491 RepID=UPI001C9B9645|nr:hypothetical protein [Clostridium botulinum]MBY6809091.1 hypothetical protein [Clostridium botulinum]MBY6822204.1 hypothetical protein [Clostridium botulinum]MBY6833006.1 hypothetical protein [Clostridium botulinum]MBY6972234.1 hypothetical protein [Clostridium botulinum]MCS6103506.1 hypothetical protein [Clostridium botulinum]